MQTLESLPKELLARSWPPDRVVQGTRVCKRLARVLVEHSREVTLSFHGRCSSTCAEEIARDIARFQGKASLRIQSGKVQIDSPCSCLLLVHGLELASRDLKQSLTHLDMSYICLGSEGTKRLAGVLCFVKHLEHLNLKSVSMFCEGAERLAISLTQTKQLTHLIVASNALKRQGAQAIALTFKHLNRLAYLDLSDNRFLKEGAQALAQQLGHCKALTHFDVSYNLITEEGLIALANALATCPRLRFVRLAWTLLTGEDGGLGLATLAQCSELSELVLNNNSSCFDAALPDIFASGAFPELTRLQSTYNTFPPNKIIAIAHCSHLTELDLSSNCLGWHNAGQCVVPLLEQCTRITDLNLARNFLERDGVGELASALRSCVSLRRLNLSTNMLEDEGAEKIAEEMESARFGQQLEALSLNGCLLGAGGVQRLVKALGGCPRLAELALGNNVFGDEGAIALADLQRCSGLTDLKLDDSRFSRVGTARMLWLAATCTQIQRLDLSDKGGPLEVFAASADWLEGNTGLELKLCGLQSVDLSGLRLHDDIAGLARVLGASQQLRHLNLSKNLSTDAGATGLASGLALCSTLTHLDMGHNQIRSLGATALADALSQCHLMASLDLEFNDIALDGAERLERLLRSCHLLAWLNLRGNKRCKGPEVEELLGECGYPASMRTHYSPYLT